LKLKSITDGEAEFGADDDYFQFRLHFLRVSLWVAIIFSGALILEDWGGNQPPGSHPPHFHGNIFPF
jgi:hypothetical protein